MARRRIFGVTALAAAALFSGPVLSTADGPDHFEVVGSEPAALRAGPALDAETITLLPPAAVLTNGGCEGGPSAAEWADLNAEQQAAARQGIWCRVSYRDASGWVQIARIAELSAPAQPTFDCGAATGSVEKLICSDPVLRVLDHRLGRVYGRALERAGAMDVDAGAGQAGLRAAQRGWIKGRNECWKEREAAACVRTAYDRRLAFLTARWRLAPPVEVLQLRCEDRAEFIVSRFQGSPLDSVAVESGDATQIMVAVKPAAETFIGEFGRSLDVQAGEARVVWEANGSPRHCAIGSLAAPGR